MKREEIGVIDPAIIDLMHHMSKAPPAIERSADAGAWVQTVETGERHVQTIERQIEEWITETETRVSAIAASARSEPDREAALHRLNQAIEAFEASIPREAAFFSRAEKRTLVTVKRAKAASHIAGQRTAAQRQRILRAFAAYGLAKQDVVFALRAIRADLTGEGRVGPIFDSPSDLGAYLRDAVA